MSEVEIINLDAPIIKRLEELSNYTEMMLDKPAMFAQSPEALEMSLLSVFNCWAIIIDTPLNVRTLWREEIKLCYPNSERGYSTVSLQCPKLADGQPGIPGLDQERQSDWQGRITHHMRRVWNQLKYTGYK